MGVHPMIDFDSFPEQSDMVGETVGVSFKSGELYGTIVRDDMNFPRLNRRIVKLGDGRYIFQHTTDSDEVLRVSDSPLNEVNNLMFENGGYPKQGNLLNQRVSVCFNYDTSKTIDGTVLRDDHEAPFKSIIRLDDGRHITMGECQYTW